jgi:hypothetical protein
LTHLLNRDTINSDMREMKIEIDEKTAIKQIKKALTCDMCGTAGTPATEKELAKGFDNSNKVWEWCNEYDCGTICDDCQENVNDSQ